MSTGGSGRPVHNRKMPEPKVGSAGGGTGEQRAAMLGLAPCVMRNGLLAIAVVVAAVVGVILLVQGDNGQNPPLGRGGNPPYATPLAYELFWKANAPGTLTAEQAFASETTVLRQSDGVSVPPVASLWVAQSADAALILAQLDPQGHWLTVVALARSGEGSGAVWQASIGDWPTAVYCTNDSSLPDGTCNEGKLTSPDERRLSELWSWSAPGSTLGVTARFLEPLTSPPSGGTLAGLALSVGSAQEADGSTVVAVGTGAAAAEQQRAVSFAAAGQ